jgi:F420-dependent oxidoreductase-like protein
MEKRIGLVVNRVSGVRNVVNMARQAEEQGLYCAWLTSGAGEDCMPLLAAIAQETQTIRLGTSVVQTFPRHPYILAAETNVIDQLSPGRFRLGVGPSHKILMESLGLDYVDPLAELREYVEILKELFTSGSVDYTGEHYRVAASISRTVSVPVMVGTLQPAAFRLAGAIADGAITWLCPPNYLRSIAVPAMQESAARAGRAAPPLIAHLAVSAHPNAQEVHDEVRGSMPNIRLPSYQNMLVAAGYPSAKNGEWTDDLIDDVVAWGDQHRIAERVNALFDAGAEEVLVRPFGAGPNPDEVVEETVRCVSAIH